VEGPNEVNAGNVKKLYAAIIAIALICLNLLACGEAAIPLAFSYDNPNLPSTDSYESPARLTPFADTLCVGEANVAGAGYINMETANAAGLFDINNKKILYAKNIFDKQYPASLTKVMTAIIVLENAELSDRIEVTDAAAVDEQGATLIGIKKGDSLTVEQALKFTLIASANDAANMLAVYVAGSIDNFTSSMNLKALELGATGTHFENANGLTAKTHYTTVYDMYLIFAEAMKYDEFVDIISTKEYATGYQLSDGSIKEVEIASTNRYFAGTAEAPFGITVIGAKTGTTAAAASCLVLLANDSAGNPYIAIILHSETRESLYKQMNGLLESVG